MRVKVSTPVENAASQFCDTATITLLVKDESEAVDARQLVRLCERYKLLVTPATDERVKLAVANDEEFAIASANAWETILADIMKLEVDHEVQDKVYASAMRLKDAGRRAPERVERFAIEVADHVTWSAQLVWECGQRQEVLQFRPKGGTRWFARDKK